MADTPHWLDDDRAQHLEVYSTAPTCICVWHNEPKKIDGHVHWMLRQRNRKCPHHGEKGDR